VESSKTNYKALTGGHTDHFAIVTVIYNLRILSI